jgi:ankyrin repeat protein
LGGPPAAGVTWGGGSQPTGFFMESGISSTEHSIQSIVEGMRYATLGSDELGNLIGAFPHILGETYDGLTLLHWAVYWAMSGTRELRHVEYVDTLAFNNGFINKGAGSSARFPSSQDQIFDFLTQLTITIGATPLHLAMYMVDNVQEDFAIIQMLLIQGADIKAVDTIGRTPLKVVFGGLKAREKIANAKRLDSKVREVRSRLRSAEIGLLQLFGASFRERALKDEDIKKFIGWMLYDAVISGNQSFVEVILKAVQVIFKNDDSSVINSVYVGKTLLMSALDKGYSQIAVYLINEGVKLTDFLLHYAVKMKDIDLVRALTAAEVDINKKDALNRTALVWAVEEGKACIEIIKELIDYGAEVNDLVRPALEAALYLDRNNGQIEIMKILIDTKADVNAMQGGLLKKALKLNTKEPALLLLRAGAQLVHLEVKYMPNPDKRYFDMVGLGEQDLDSGHNLQEDETIALKNRSHYAVGNDLIEAIILRDHDKLDKGLHLWCAAVGASRDWRFKSIIRKLAAQGVSGKVKSYTGKKAESYTDSDAEGWMLRMWAAAQGNNRAFSIIEESPAHKDFDNRYNQMESLSSGIKTLYCKNYEAIEESMNFYAKKGLLHKNVI